MYPISDRVFDIRTKFVWLTSVAPSLEYTKGGHRGRLQIDLENSFPRALCAVCLSKLEGFLVEDLLLEVCTGAGSFRAFHSLLRSGDCVVVVLSFVRSPCFVPLVFNLAARRTPEMRRSSPSNACR